MKFELLEGRIHGARYYTVKPEFNWWEPGVISGPSWRDMMEWTVSTFGPSPGMGVWTEGGRWYANNAKFWFRREQDRTLFLLRFA